jgi:hypothetical protein
VDVHEFDDLIEVSARHAHSITWDCRPCLDRLEGACVLYAGEFLLGLSLKGCLELEEWLRLQRENFRMKMIRSLGWLSQGWEAAGELEKALDFANRWVVLDPLDEAAHRKVMQVLSHLRRRSDALAQYAACQRILRDELGVEPDAETTALYQQIKIPSGGKQAGEGSLSNLPSRLAPLVGRQAELERLQKNLLNPDCRLVTLLGPGGVGKTSLALEAGRNLLPAFPGGVFLVELDTQQAGLSLLPLVAQSVGLVLRSGPGQGTRNAQEKVLDQLSDFLKDQDLLLILDGFEGLLHETKQVSDLLRLLPEI